MYVKFFAHLQNQRARINRPMQTATRIKEKKNTRATLHRRDPVAKLTWRL